MEFSTIEINGSLLLLIFLLIAAFFLSSYSYLRTIPPVPNSRRYSLIAFRTLALWSLIILLFKPIINNTKSFFENPKIAVLIDDSRSMAFENDNFSNFSQYQKVLNELDIPNRENLEIIKFSYSSEHLDKLNIDSLSIDGNLTDIDRALKLNENLSQDKNIKSVILISDGNVNSGPNPIYTSEKYSLPIYSIGIGDTSRKRDLILETVINNDIAYINNSIPISVSVKQIGFEDEDVIVNLLEDGSNLKSQTFTTVKDKENYQLIFEYLPESSGNKKIEVKIDQSENELTFKNNYQTSFVKVLENKRKISLFAGSPSADVAFMNKYWSDKKGVELSQYIQRSGGDYYKEPTISDIINSELFIFIGFPNIYTSKEILLAIETELDKGKPFLFMNSYDIDFGNLEYFKKHLPFNFISQGRKEFKASVYLDQSDINDPLVRISGSEEELNVWNDLPPLFKTESFVKASLGSKTIMRMKLDNSVIDEPMILRREIDSKKSVAILPYGLYLWQLDHARKSMNSNYDTPSYYTVLMDNIFKWLSVKENKSQFTIKTNKRNYNQSESIIFIAQYYDEKFDPINNANIQVELQDSLENRLISLKSMGNGRYISEVEGLTSGDKFYQAKAIIEGKNSASDNGRFFIGETPIEFLQTSMNEKLLSEISNLSGGKFYYPDNISTIFEDINSNSNFKRIAKTLVTRDELWENPIFLILSILFFSTEWFIRKRSGMI